MKKRKEKPIIVYTDHPVNQFVMKSFAIGLKIAEEVHVKDFNDISKPFISYGYLRGTGPLFKKSNQFWYIDHGYFNQSSRNFSDGRTYIDKADGYFRVVYNNFWDCGLNRDWPSDRFDKLNISIKPQKKDGEYIVLSETIPQAVEYYNLHNWTTETIKKIREFSDRKILIHDRTSPVPLDEILKKAFAFVSDHSSAGFKAMIEGVPAFYTNDALKGIGKIDNIENHKINYKLFNNLAYGQWTIEEMKSGEAWENLSLIE